MSVSVKVIEIPIAIRALKTASIYVVSSENKNILVDTGMDSQIDVFLKGSGIDINQIDGVVLTHMHIDHLGGSSRLGTKFGIKSYLGARDMERVSAIQNSPEKFIEWQKEYLTMHGVPNFYTDSMNKFHPVYTELKNYLTLNTDDFEEYSNLRNIFNVIRTPGHSPGSTCFETLDGKNLFTGDHVLERITPNISYYDENEDMLDEYIKSLNLIRENKSENIFPGHGKPFHSLKENIDRILKHHEDRLDEVRRICANNRISAYEVAGKMKWSKGRTLESMNLMEANFAIGEAISHLRYLSHHGQIEEIMPGSNILYKG